MILADKIAELRKKNGWSQEELAEKLDVSRQAISKWEGAQSVPDMNRILKMSEIFGVSTDCLLKDDMSLQPAEASDAAGAEDGKTYPVSMEEASGFLSHAERSSRRISLGVMMCVLSPILLILLSAYREAGALAMRESAALGLGLLALILLVGGAVALFVTVGLAGQRYEYIQKEEIDTAYGVDGIVRDRREKFRPTFTAQLVTGIVLCVLSAVPIFVAMICFDGQDTAYAAAVGALLALVAVGCLLIVRVCVVWGSFQALLQEGEYTPEKKAESKRTAPIAAIYWGLVTAGFLAASFISRSWDKTWIVWPVAGVAYGALIAILGAIRNRKQN